MRVEGQVWKRGKFWLIEIPMLDAMTQGHTKREALAMISDAIEMLVDLPGFVVTVHAGRGAGFEISANDSAPLIAMMLRRLRRKSGLTLTEVAMRLRQTSPNAYARYEQGTSVPTIQKLDELLKALDPEADFVIRAA